MQNLWQKGTGLFEVFLLHGKTWVERERLHPKASGIQSSAFCFAGKINNVTTISVTGTTLDGTLARDTRAKRVQKYRYIPVQRTSMK